MSIRAPHPPRRRSAGGLAGVLALGLSLSLAACGGGDPAPSEDAGAPARRPVTPRALPPRRRPPPRPTLPGRRRPGRRTTATPATSTTAATPGSAGPTSPTTPVGTSTSPGSMPPVRARSRSGRRPKDPPIDCFYVYPTVSADQGANSDMTVGPDDSEVQTVAAQAAQYARSCRVFAPIYRQVTLAALFAGQLRRGRRAGLRRRAGRLEDLRRRSSRTVAASSSSGTRRGR